MTALDKIGLGGGCHWCTEAVFQALRGVSKVKQGFIASTPPDDAYSEAAIVHFDADIIDLATLIEIHLRTHSAVSDHKMRGKYRSAIYVFDEAQGDRAREALRVLQDQFDRPLVTRVLSLGAFKPSDARFQNYAEKNADGPFCKNYIDPKLALLRREFGANLRDEARSGVDI